MYFVNLRITTPSGNTTPFDAKREGMMPFLNILKSLFAAGSTETIGEFDGQHLICKRPDLTKNKATVTTAKGKVFTFTWTSVYMKPRLGEEGDDCYSDDDTMGLTRACFGY